MRPIRSARPAAAVSHFARVEEAEPRVMLDGGVTVAFNADGVLVIGGDSEGNDLTVDIDGVEGTVSFRADNTTVNGEGAASVVLDVPDGGIAGIDINLSAGDDRLEVLGGQTLDGSFARAEIGGDVLIRGRGGADRVVVSGLEIAGDIRVVGDTGDDALTLENLEAEEVLLEGGLGEDTLMLDAVRAEESLRAYGHNGGDVIAARDVFVADEDDLPRLYGEAGEDDVGAEDLGGRVIARQNAGLAPPVVSDGVRPEDREALDRLFEEAERAAGRDLFGGDAISLPGAGFPIGFEAFDRSQFTATESGLLYRVVGAGRPGPAARAAAIETDVQRVDAGDGRVVSDSFRTAASNLPAAGTPLGVEIEAILRTAGLYARVQFLVPGDLRGEAGGLFAGVGGPAFLNVQVTGVRR